MKTTGLLHNHVVTGTLYAGAVLFLAAGASAQNLYVSAGSSSDAEILQYTPSGGESLVASGMDYPDGIAFNSAGDLFVANDALNAGESGNITEIMPGGGTSVFASNVDPQDLAFDSAGDLFECEYRSGNINEFKNNNGTLSSTPTVFATGFANPLSLAFDSAGNLYVGAGYGAGNGYITKIAPGNVQSSFATGLTFPTGLAFNGVGDLFVCDQGTGIIYEYTPGGVRSTFVTLSETDLDGLAFNSADDLFVAAGHSSDIVEVTPNGTPSVFESVGSGLGFADGVAFQGEALPAPEPSTLALLAVGASAVAWRLRRKK
jgi:sugar lactone lactonase YvrE